MSRTIQAGELAEKLLTPQEAAEFLATSLRHIRSLVSTRKIPTVKVGHLVRIKQCDLVAFVEANTREAIGG